MSNQSDFSSIDTRVGQLLASTVTMENEFHRVMEESAKVQTDWQKVKQMQTHSGDAEKYRVALEQIVILGRDPNSWEGPALDMLKIAEDALGVIK